MSDFSPSPTDRISLNQLPKYLPSKNGRRVHQTTVWRWVNKGKNGIKLAVEWDLTGGYTTSLKDVAEFERKVARAIGVKPSKRAVSTDKQLAAGGW